MSLLCVLFPLFFFNDTATTEIYTLSLHDALPISPMSSWTPASRSRWWCGARRRPGRGLAEGACEPGSSAGRRARPRRSRRSEEHTSELQSLAYLVCRLLLEKKNMLTSAIMELGIA